MKKLSDNELESIKFRKSNFFYALIVVLLIIIVSAVSLTIFAWAKYNSRNNGQATAEIAKWYFKVIGNGEQSVDNINFSITRTDSNRFG